MHYFQMYFTVAERADGRFDLRLSGHDYQDSADGKGGFSELRADEMPKGLEAAVADWAGTLPNHFIIGKES